MKRDVSGLLADDHSLGHDADHHPATLAIQERHERVANAMSCAAQRLCSRVSDLSQAMSDRRAATGSWLKRCKKSTSHPIEEFVAECLRMRLAKLAQCVLHEGLAQEGVA